MNKKQINELLEACKIETIDLSDKEKEVMAEAIKQEFIPDPEINFNDAKFALSEEDENQLVDIIGYRCSWKTKARIRRRLENSDVLPFASIFNRLVRKGDEWRYQAGQSYTDEIRTIREIILD